MNLLIGLSLLVTVASAAFSCKDQNNNDVDWFAVYKMPIESNDDSIPGIKDGTGWYYCDANNPTPLVPSPVTLVENNQAIAYTLQQYYSQQADPSIFHVMYNDEPYNGTDAIHLNPHVSVLISSSYAHSKGVSFFDKTSGIWLVHSVPQFPPPKSYEYPPSGHDYGQTMLCMSFAYSELNKIGTQLYYNRPYLYSSALPTDMGADNPDLAQFFGGNYAKGAPCTSVIDLKTKGGNTFKSFAKCKDFGEDLYDGLVAPTLKVNLDVETWRRGDEVPVNCTLPYYSVDALDIKVGTTSEFKYTKDHSKFAVSKDPTNAWTCIGDINRMTSQYKRGGGTECYKSTFLWSSYTVIVDDKDGC